MGFVGKPGNPVVSCGMQYKRIYESAKGGIVDLHPWHGDDELPDNSQAAMILAEYGYAIELLPTIPEAEAEERRKWLSDVVSPKNPDVRINGKMIGDIKTPNKSVIIRKATINNCIYSCAKQKVSIAIINLVGRQYALQDIKKGIIGALQPDRNRSIEEVWIITAEKKLFQAVRDKVFDESIYDQLAEL